MNAWMAGEYDVLVQTADAFPLYTAPDEINAFQPKAFMQVDWSRGGDAVIVKRGIQTANDLKGKRIAVAVPSPAQTLLTNTLEAAGLKYSDVVVVKTSDNLKAAELFRSGDIDAAVVWSPDDLKATADVPGSKVLVTTVQQSHIIADIMFASQKTIDEKKNMIHGFYEGWMKGIAELNGNPQNQELAAKFLGEINGLSKDDGLGMMSTVYWTGHGDNVNFFGLNSGFKGQKGQDLYEKMSRKFVQTGDSPKEAPAWRSVIYTGALTAADANLSGSQYAAEKSREFNPVTETEKVAPAIASKPISITFQTGQFQLDENAKTIIDLQFADIAKSFANVKVRIEGNTDNTGSAATNKKLSRKRAKSVADYLQNQYGMDPNRFIIVGNGPDKPVEGCEENQTTECRARNRRTEFQLIEG
jgi:NitT/TauT family transport system substrate-binding protein